MDSLLTRMDIDLLRALLSAEMGRERLHVVHFTGDERRYKRLRRVRRKLEEMRSDGSE